MSRILLIADAYQGSEALAAEIAKGPHTVKSVAPGDARLQAMRDWEPDVIVMDLATDGAALPLRIRMMRDPQIARIPFVVVGDVEEEARALGANAFVRSPAPIESFLELLARFGALRMPLPA